MPVSYLPSVTGSSLKNGLFGVKDDSCLWSDHCARTRTWVLVPRSHVKAQTWWCTLTISAHQALGKIQANKRSCLRINKRRRASEEYHWGCPPASTCVLTHMCMHANTNTHTHTQGSGLFGVNVNWKASSLSYADEGYDFIGNNGALLPINMCISFQPFWITAFISV